MMQLLQLTLLQVTLVSVHAFPGAPHLKPAIHYAPPQISEHGGWHDIAGAITHKGVHHIYQGPGIHFIIYVRACVCVCVCMCVCARP